MVSDSIILDNQKKKMNMEDCFDEILKFYEETVQDEFFEVEKEKWLYNSKYLINLMKHLDKESNNYERVKNCILFLMNLCFDIKDPDHYHSKGKSTEELTKTEKENYKILLKTECSTLLN